MKKTPREAPDTTQPKIDLFTNYEDAKLCELNWDEPLMHGNRYEIFESGKFMEGRLVLNAGEEFFSAISNNGEYALIVLNKKNKKLPFIVSMSLEKYENLIKDPVFRACLNRRGENGPMSKERASVVLGKKEGMFREGDSTVTIAKLQADARRALKRNGDKEDKSAV